MPNGLFRAYRIGRKNPDDQVGPCGIGGIGRILSPHYTYVSAPVVNYIFGCGSRPVLPDSYSQGGGDHEGPPPPPPVEEPPNHFAGLQQLGAALGFFRGGQSQGQDDKRPLVLQTVVNAAATRIGHAIADYLTKPPEPESKGLFRTLRGWIKD